MPDNGQNVHVELYPIDWQSSSSRSTNTVNSDNKNNASTAMFYGQEHNQAGWLSIFKNTRKQKITINTIWALIGSAPNSEVKASVVCKPLGKSYNNKLDYVTTESKYTTHITKTNTYFASSLSSTGADTSIIPNDYILTTNKIAVWTVVTLDEPIEVKPNEYFCAGVVSYDIPIDQYINIAKDNTTQTIRKIFYTQAPNDSSGDFTWYRSGNQDDNTSWKRYQVYIVAKGECTTFQFDDIIDPTPERPNVRALLDVGSTEVILNQGDSVVIPIKTDTEPKSYNNTCFWNYTTNSSDNAFSFEKIDTGLRVEFKGYTQQPQEITINIIATEAITGATTSKTILLTAIPPQILSVVSTLPVLKPTQTTELSCMTLGNPGPITYIVDNTNIAKISGNRLTLTKLDTVGPSDIQVTAKTTNGDIAKTLIIPTKHWSPDDIQISFNSTVLYPDAFGNSRAKITCTNKSSNRLKTLLALSPAASASLDSLELDWGKSSTITKSSNTGNFELIATLSADNTVSKAYSLSAEIAPGTERILYPKSLRTGSTVTLPAIARYNVANRNWQVYFNTYPVYIRLNASNKPVKISLKQGTTSLKIGQAFNNSIIGDLQIIRPVPQIVSYTSKPANEISKSYTLTIKDADMEFAKSFNIKYRVYTDNSDLISATDRGQSFTSTFNKVKNTLQSIQDVLYEYDYAASRDIGYTDEYGIKKLNNSRYVTATKELAETQLRALAGFINDINTKSISFITMPNTHRTQVATGQYVMADDSSCSTENWYSGQTASPFMELGLAVKNLTDIVTHWPIYTNVTIAGKTQSGPIKKLNGQSINQLYL